MPGLTVVSLRRRRFRERDLLVRMCRAPEWPRRTLPEPVTLKRLLAPRWDFNFGTTISSASPPPEAKGCSL